MKKVRLVDPELERETTILYDETPVVLEENSAEEAAPPATDEEIAVALVDVDFIVKMPPVKEYTQKMIIRDEKPEEFIDKMMAGETLWFTAVNETGKVWSAGQCYPGCFWMKNGERVQGPATKDQPFAVDVQPGKTVFFGVMIPRFPDEKPDVLRVAVLENGVVWHTVEDIRVR